MLSDLASFPAFLSSNDLVNMGLFSSLEATYEARRKGKSPDFIKIRRKILYPRECVLAFIERHKYKGEPVPDVPPTSEKDN
ncbi:MAG: hypothetical protein WCW33_04175 [Candidatus Babeliales bacterium]|jgi:hypothetical protein